MRERLLDAMLLASAEVGYERVAVRHVLCRAGAARQSFYSHFDNKDECFAQAYETGIQRLCERVIEAAGEQPGWREGVRAGLAELVDFCASEPTVARALLIEVHVAGGAALERRSEVMTRFAAAITRGSETAALKSGNAAVPELTGILTVGAVTAVICTRLTEGEPTGIRDLLPGILHFVFLQYLGKEAAWEEMTAAPLASWEAARRGARRSLDAK